MDIDAALARRLVSAQFPQWADLPLTPVMRDGWDNRTFRLGSERLVRLPSAEPYAAQVPKEQRWLPRLAPLLPLPVPEPLALGEPGEGYPWPWSVYGWLEGEPVQTAGGLDPLVLATALADFLVALRHVDVTDGPAAGAHSFHRGGSLAVYDRETRDAVASLCDRVDASSALDVWETALASNHLGAPVWFHGDVSAANLLAVDGRLGAVIDFGTCGVGDPACDTVVAWTLFRGAAREAFRERLGLDDATWARGRGWALWKSLITLAGDPRGSAAAEATLREVLADHG